MVIFQLAVLGTLPGGGSGRGHLCGNRHGRGPRYLSSPLSIVGLVEIEAIDSSYSPVSIVGKTSFYNIPSMGVVTGEISWLIPTTR